MHAICAHRTQHNTTYNDSQFPWSTNSSTDEAPPPVFHSTSSLSNSYNSGKRGLSTYQYHDSYDNYDQVGKNSTGAF